MPKKKKKPSFNPSMSNPAGPVDKTSATKDIPGVSDDTRVVYAEERGMDDGGL